MTPEEEHRDRVRARIVAIARQSADFHTLLSRCEGADPRLVDEIVKELGEVLSTETASRSTLDIDYSFRLPAADPFRSQWWFTGPTTQGLLKRILTLSGGAPVVCLGTPTLGFELLSAGQPVSILDVDAQVVTSLNTNSKSPNAARVYDVAEELPQADVEAYGVAVIDPPWYDDVYYAFLSRAISALKAGGDLLCSVPPRLTRPGIETFRKELVDRLVQNDLEILALEPEALRYLVPKFEQAALSHLKGFQAIPWRTADLLHARKGAASKIDAPQLKKVEIQTFSRTAHEFRAFMRGTASLDPAVTLDRLDKYSDNVSTRAHKDEIPDVWTTEKVGGRIGQIAHIEAALRAWQNGSAPTSEAIAELSKSHPAEVAKNVVERLDAVFGLWERFASLPPLRSDLAIEEAKRSSLTQWATQPSGREHPDSGDNFRGKYQRDRDRILWSNGLRRLAHKTQVFPTDHDDQVRQRLAHSIEVMQLSSTIGASFGLDKDLIEAGALAHDIGHTPFGHAGEFALNELLDQIDPKLHGFNHYEHGIDVVRWLESPYAGQEKGFFGLNLTHEVLECILKHTYSHTGNGPSTENLLATSKHSGLIQKGYCHMEGQAVRAADKISYFVSDLEDGIRLGAISQADLLSCRFFHRSPLNFSVSGGKALLDSFVEQRRNVLKLLMEDVLVATNKRLSRLKPEQVRVSGDYTVNQSTEILADMNEVWQKLQSGKLHQDFRVQRANLKAARVVSELTLLFAVSPQLVDTHFAWEHQRLWNSGYMTPYRTRVGKSIALPKRLTEFLPLDRTIGAPKASEHTTVATEHIVQAKDFVASLSDSRAKVLHEDLVRA